MANKYMYLYVGGGAPPASKAEGKAMMAKWMECFGKLGSAVCRGQRAFRAGIEIPRKGRGRPSARLFDRHC
jgi:hypothetical protein